MTPWRERGAAPAGRHGPAVPLRGRLALAVAVSVALHASLVFGLHPARAPGSIQLASVITARLAPLPAAESLAAPSGNSNAATAAQPASFDSVQAPADAQRPGRLELPLPVPRYYLASELDRNPAPLQLIEPESPPEAGSAEGAVVLRVLIDESGHVDDVTVVGAQPQDVFEKYAVAAFSRTRFSPGMLHGVPVKSQILVEVQFRNAGRNASGRSY